MTAEVDQSRRPRSGFGTRILFGLLILALVGGALLMVWLVRQRSGLDAAQPIGGMMNASGGEAGQNAAEGPAQPVTTVTSANVDAQAARIAELEQRLARITLAAQAASYNANRAEALLTAFAARRALDAGRPLGYVEGTLRVRFGEAQPRAVATIVNAAAEPVTLADLRLGIQDIAVARSRPSGGSWWSGFWQEIGGIAIIRKAGAPSPEPEQRLARARHAVELGQIDDAITDMSALPPQPGVGRWLELARRYNEAHRALDVIEAAAILEPRATPGMSAGLVPNEVAVPTPAPAETESAPAGNAAAN